MSPDCTASSFVLYFMTARGLATDLLYETFLIHYFVDGLAFNKLSKNSFQSLPLVVSSLLSQTQMLEASFLFLKSFKEDATLLFQIIMQER